MNKDCIIVKTSADDVHSYLKCSFERFSIEELEINIEYEKRNSNRSTVLKYLKRAIRLKTLGAKKY
jgi:hypothetical protein